MKKRALAMILALCAALLLFAACEKEQQQQRTPITIDEAVQIVLEEADITADQAQPHVHGGKYEGQECYLVYVTSGGKNLVYAVQCFTGEILNISESSHSH